MKNISLCKPNRTLVGKMLKLYNSLTRKTEPFEPRMDREVKMFTCGPSVYQRPHIGNYRTFLFEDVLQRYLEYLGFRVIRALNLTDIEDKSIEEAQKRKMDVLELTQRCASVFFEDLKLLRIKSPTYIPRSSASVERAVSLIQELLKKGHAYWYKGNVYFDPLTFKGFGKLAHLDMSRWPSTKRRFHMDTYPGNPSNLGDFILWHGYRGYRDIRGNTVHWDTAIGRGRPAWNVQDAAMVADTLGSSIDIFCGGEDSLARHHDYTIAVIESVTEEQLARYWLHCAHLLADGKKMSKSRGDIIYPDDLLKAGYTGEESRFFMIYGHYRSRLNFTYDMFKKTSLKLRQAHEMIEAIRRAGAQGSSREAKELIGRLKPDFEKNMNSDLSVKRAFDRLLDSLSRLASLAGESEVAGQDAARALSELRNIDSVLQVLKLAP